MPQPSIGARIQTAPPPDGFIGEFLVEFGIPPSLASTIGDAAVFVVVFVGVYLFSKIVVVPAVDSILSKRGIDEHTRKPVSLLVYAVLIFAALGLAFALAGYGNILLALATVGAAATLAIGFALQNVIRNFVAGVFIYADRPFRTGDWIEWGNNSGYVEDISLRVTRVRTFDNEHLTVPNSDLTDGVLKNYDKRKTLRLKFTFRIGFEDDIDRAREIILAEANATEGVLDDPAPAVKLMEVNEASFDLQGRIWIKDPGKSDFLGIRGRFVQSVVERFEREGITIPYPHRTIDGGLDSAKAHSDAPSDD